MKPSFIDLTPVQQLEYGNGCGLDARLLRVPDFIFSASCAHHDFNYERGGTLMDKLQADFDFCAHMWSDSFLWWHYVVTIIYFLGVILNPISYFAFTYGPWRSVEAILLKDRLSKL